MVVAVTDGAPWIQASSTCTVPPPSASWTSRTPSGTSPKRRRRPLVPVPRPTREWLAIQAHDLKQGDPDGVLAALDALPPSPARDDAVRYLTERRAQIAYGTFIANGFPIGSGRIPRAPTSTSSNAASRGGTYRSRAHLNPMLGLRTVVANDRWATASP